MSKPVIFWFRRDLRLQDNAALAAATQSGKKVIPVFIFDSEIVDELPRNDPRVNFLYDELLKINTELQTFASSIRIYKGNPLEAWQSIVKEFAPDSVYVNKDYEPYARKRDTAIVEFLEEQAVPSYWYKDQVIFEEGDILKKDGTPYTIYTPYKKQWLLRYDEKEHAQEHKVLPNFEAASFEFPTREQLGIEKNLISVKPIVTNQLATYDETRDFPAKASTSNLGPHLRFGTVSVRQWVRYAQATNEIFLSELIWREFFMQILWHFPQSVQHNFKPKYDGIAWRNDEQEFKAWCAGKTGYPMVDAGMRELNATGYMHNRVRMVTASFLCKHLLIDWRWGEAYFAQHLLDYEQASNVGNWQWAAGTGCDASPYFRVFNPESQMKKFDKGLAYVTKWVPEFQELTYVKPIVEHKFARQRALDTYKIGLSN